MGNAFFIFDPSTSSKIKQRDDKIVPDPIILGDVEIIEDGKRKTITATNGQELYVVVKPGDYPENEAQRKRRRGTALL